MMAYTSYQELDPFGPSEGKLETCTPAEDQAPSPFYPEDLLLISQQPGFATLQKHMARFWGRRWQVWAGYDGDGKLLEEVIAIRCPPYYREFSTAGVKVFHDDPVREDFMQENGDFS
ncbi:MAG: hypothetical protein MUC59_07385 [Saprospiraceae bacterium]|nr:hypothetical protein [Saprospiraceae bacterium]